MRTRGTPGAAHVCYYLTTPDFLPSDHIELGKMRVGGDAPPAMGDLQISAAVSMAPHLEHSTAPGGNNRCTSAGANI